MSLGTLLPPLLSRRFFIALFILSLLLVLLHVLYKVATTKGGGSWLERFGLALTEKLRYLPWLIGAIGLALLGTYNITAFTIVAIGSFACFLLWIVCLTFKNNASPYRRQRDTIDAESAISQIPGAPPAELIKSSPIKQQQKRMYPDLVILK